MADLSQEFYGVDSELIEQGTQIVGGLINKVKAKKAAKKKASEIKSLQAKIKEQEATKAKLAQKVAAKKAAQPKAPVSKPNNTKTILIVSGIGIVITVGLILLLRK